MSVGHDNLFHGDKYKVSLQLTAINLANNFALYNFLSTFSGTHYVTPRALTAQLGFPSNPHRATGPRQKYDRGPLSMESAEGDPHELSAPTGMRI